MFWRRTSVRLARSPFKNHSKTCVLARVLAMYLYTFGSKPVQKSTKNVCFGTCFGNLRANEEVEHMNTALLMRCCCAVDFLCMPRKLNVFFGG